MSQWAQLPDGNWLEFPDDATPEAMQRGVKNHIAAAPGPTQDKAAADPQARTEMLREQYNQLPWYEQAMQAADDVARFGLDTASFGGADKLASLLPGGGTIEEERRKTADARARSTGASTAFDVAQAIKAPQVLGKNLGLFGLGADAALYSGAQSYGHGSTGEQALKDAALGGGAALTLGGALPALRGVARPVAATSPFRSPYAAMGHLTHTIANPSTGLPALGTSLAGDVADRILRTRGAQGLQEILRTTARTVPVAPTFRREDRK
jgi:hypothetical protein